MRAEEELSCRAILEAVEAAGCSLSLAPDNTLLCRPGSKLPAALAERIRAHAESLRLMLAAEAALAAYAPDSAVDLVEVVEFDGRYVVVNPTAFDAFLAELRQHNEWVARRWEKNKHKAWVPQKAKDPGYTKAPEAFEDSPDDD